MSRTSLFLTGGLGNQLFQLAAGLSRESTELILDWNLGNPRLNKLGNPDITDLQLPTQVHLDPQYKKNRFFSKFSGYLLRQGMQPTRIEKLFRLGKIMPFILGKLLFFRFGHQIKVVQATDNGYFKMGKTSQNEYLVGYFQSYRWASLPTVESQLQSLSLIQASHELLAFVKEIENQKTVMVHVRLGDYNEQKNFGIPSIDYYRFALSELEITQQFDRILLFSNEPHLAWSFIPVEYHEIICVAPDFSGNSAETLEAMRHAKSYIIGNSSLSWWGAKLSHTQGARVIAPTPWFKTAPEPRDLIPPGWIRKDAFHK